MARIRTVKPSFFRSQDIADLTISARLTFIGLFTYVDDAGRGKADARLIKGDVWPLDDDITHEQVEAILSELERNGRIVRYEVDGIRYLEVVNFLRHQKINRPSPSTIPPSPLTESSLSTHGAVTEDSRQEGKGREGNKEGKGEPPSRYCINHPTGTSNNCGACGDARMTYLLWEREQREKRDRPAPVPRLDLSQFCQVDGHADYPLPCDKCAREHEEAA